MCDNEQKVPGDSKVRTYEFLMEEFLSAMNDIGRYGRLKHGCLAVNVNAFIAPKRYDRTSSEAFKRHAAEHFRQALKGVRHDAFDTVLHQLAAVAYNAMLEAYFISKGK